MLDISEKFSVAMKKIASAAIWGSLKRFRVSLGARGSGLGLVWGLMEAD